MQRRYQVCIAGGGPAGLMLGVLLARAGLSVAVLEKHADFLRDFRGDTIHPSTMQVLHELGWLDEFLALPHQQVRHLTAQFGDERMMVADFSHLPVAAPFVAMMPQWDFLNFLAAKGATYPGFTLLMRTEAQTLVQDGDGVIGLKADSPEGALTILAELIVAADGRTSVLRRDAQLDVQDLGAPMDVLWFRLPREATDTSESQGRFDRGRVFIMLNRGDYWQCAFVIPKGADEKVRDDGLAAFQNSVGALLPFEAERATEINSLDDVKLLKVQVDRLKTWWRPGFLCIGDAAHAMSPVGGVGVNLAIQDAVAAANLLTAPLRDGTLKDGDLAAVQARREWPTEMTQRLQLLMQDAIIAPTLAANGPLKPPLFLRAMNWIPFLAQLPARLIGLGVRPEHVAIENPRTG
ncbi:MAG: FAD-dependent oxidoreductase [Hyphomicrobium sp.]|nr:FAD-dependent oxidoreductase [Hyphomicrobium sp.]